MKGGMGALSESIARSAQSYGATIHVDSRVEDTQLDFFGGKSYKAGGVVVKKSDGQLAFFYADVIVSGVDPKLTFEKLLWDVPQVEAIRRKLAKKKFTTATTKVNMVLSGIPEFTSRRFWPVPPVKREPGPEHRGTIHIAPTVEYINRAIWECVSGSPSTEPILEMTIPSVLDSTIAPPGKHVASILVQFTPYTHPDDPEGEWEYRKKEYFTNHIVPAMEKYIPNIRSIIEWFEVLDPQSLEREIGLTGGNLFHGNMEIGQLFWNRPIRGMADYRTPIRGLYLCSSATHPGGGVTGAPGRNAAREILSDIGSS
jgi:phytoene dehydrogenase-like protein